MLNFNNVSVSVVIPSYNYARSLGACIEAILAQTHTPHEIIVVDDHSTDSSFAIAKNYPAKVLQTPVNSGVAAARNLGLSHATGDIVFFVDADVVLDPCAIEAALLQFVKFEDVVSVCGLYEPRPLFRDSLWEEFRSLQAYVWRAASLGNVSGGFFSLGAIRKDVLDKVGLFNENLRQTEEIDYGERLTRHGRIVLTDLVRGRHDDDDAFLPMMRKFWRRSRDRVPFYFQKKGLMQGFELPRRLMGTALVGLCWMLVVLAFWLPILALLGLLASVVAIIVNERDIYSEAWAVLGIRKLPAFLFWYLSFHTAAGLGVLAGLIMYVISPEFRQLYGDWDGVPAVN